MESFSCMEVSERTGLENLGKSRISIFTQDGFCRYQKLRLPLVERDASKAQPWEDISLVGRQMFLALLGELRDFTPKAFPVREEKKYSAIFDFGGRRLECLTGGSGPVLEIRNFRELWLSF